jgi:predicted GNAT family N-acyltransferase
MAFTIRRASGADLASAHALRQAVFVVEQGVPAELEHDAQDATADHVVALDDTGAVVATGRLLVADARTGKVGRMAVAASVRGKGAGAAVLAELERIARERGLTEIVLHAQTSARGFYDRAGYRAEGDLYWEAGIEHITMRKGL